MSAPDFPPTRIRSIPVTATDQLLGRMGRPPLPAVRAVPAGRRAAADRVPGWRRARPLAALGLTVLAAVLVASHARAAVPSGGIRPPVAEPAASTPADPAAQPWWSGFHDPVLGDLLGRLSQDRTLQVEARRELATRTAGLYVQMRTLALRMQLLDEWLGLLHEQVATLQAQGPTREAAQARSALEQQVLALEQRQQLLVSRLQAWKAVLARLQGSDLALPEGLDRQLMQPTAPLYVPEGPAAVLALRWASDETRAQLGRREQALEAAEQVWLRQKEALLEIQRKRSVQLASEAEVVQAVQQLLTRIDQLADAATQLALVWIGIFADAPIGVVEAQFRP